MIDFGITKFGEVVVAEKEITARNFVFTGGDFPTAQIAALWWAYGEIKEALRQAGEAVP